MYHYNLVFISSAYVEKYIQLLNYESLFKHSPSHGVMIQSSRLAHTVDIISIPKDPLPWNCLSQFL